MKIQIIQSDGDLSITKVKIKILKRIYKQLFKETIFILSMVFDHDELKSLVDLNFHIFIYCSSRHQDEFENCQQ